MKNFVKSVIGCTVLGLISLGMSGCGGAVSPMQQEKLTNFGVADIQKNIQNVKDAKNIAKLDFYSPNNLSNATDYAYEALSMHKDNDDKADIYEKVKLSKQYLASAYNVKSIIKKELKEILVYKEKLDTLHANELFNDEYSDISESIADMINGIEEGEGIKSFEDREETLMKSKALFSKIKVSSSLHIAKEILQSINQDIVPITYKQANAVYENAKFAITKFPDDEKIIKEKTQEVLNEALYAQTIQKESKKLIDLDTNVELFVKDKHEKLINIYNLINKENQKFRTLSYSSKVSKLKDITKHMIQERKSLKSENEVLLSNAKKDKKLIVDSDTKLKQQQLKITSLETNIKNSSERLLKSKDGILDVNSKFMKSQNELALLKTSVEKKKKEGKEKNKTILELQETKDTLNKKINTLNSKLKKALKNNTQLNEKLEDIDLVVKALKSEIKTLKSKNKALSKKSDKVVIKEVVKNRSTE